MNYKITREDSQRIVFTTKSASERHRYTPLIITAAFLGTGFGLHYFFGMGDMPWGIIKFVCWLIGGFILIVWISTPEGVSYLLPDLTLDNTVGALVVSRGDGRACIPYQSIAKFDIHVRTSSSKNSSPTHYHYVYAECKDGSKWFLTGSTISREPAEQILKKVIAHCRLDQPFTGSDQPSRKPMLRFSETSDKFAVGWFNQIKGRPLRLFVASAAVLGVISLLAHATVTSDDPGQQGIGTMFTLVATAFLLIPAYLIYRAARRLIRDIRYKYSLVASPDGIEYSEFSKKSGVRESSQHYPWSKITAIKYHFSEDLGYDHPVVVDLGKDEYEEFHFDQAGPVERLQVANALRRFHERFTNPVQGD